MLNRLSSVMAEGRSTTHGYEKSSLQTRIEYSNGVSSTTIYDKAPRVKCVVHAKRAVNLSGTDYEYDANGNRSKETINRTGGAQVTTYLRRGRPPGANEGGRAAADSDHGL